MRDVIWTIIILWVVFKIIGVFKSINTQKQQHNSNSNKSFQSKKEGSVTVDVSDSHSKKSVKLDVEDGEYVDYEEIK